MTSILTLTRAELEQTLAAVLAYNGQTAGEIGFTDAAGQRVEFAHVHIACEAPALSVRTQREPTAQERAMEISRSNPLDPRKVEPPATVDQLSALVESGS